MTDTPPPGPPMLLLTHRERARRRRVTIIGIAVLSAFGIALFLLALGAATKPGADVHLGSTTFKVGRASALAKRIEADNFPLLFQDLQDKSTDIFVQHVSTNHLFGWRAIEAHAPNAPRTCQLEWTGDEFRDPCDNTMYPADGTGLRRFAVHVVDGVVYVNFRQPIEPSA